jgi:hypothetical protein
MSFKQFEEWCNDRACDGRWGMLEAIVCIDIIDKIISAPFWKRKKLWEKEYKEKVLDEIVNPINDKISKLK